MPRRIFQIAFFLAALVSVGGWVWLLGLGIGWLISDDSTVSDSQEPFP
jgi:hypothetical protein